MKKRFASLLLTGKAATLPLLPTSSFEGMMKNVLAGLTGFILYFVLIINAYALDAPELTVSTSGTTVTLSWTPVSGATGYTLYYAPYPYEGEDTIGSADMGTSTDFSVTLWDGATYYVAMSSRSGGDESGYSNISLFELSAPTYTTVQTVTSAGQVWMDRNLGASRVAISYDDSEAYGDLYQWGRGSDGHEKLNSPTTFTPSSIDEPGHGIFIARTSSTLKDWRSPQNDNLWQGEAGINNPCPAGFRLPTMQEWEAERASWDSQDAAGAFASPLKLVAAGGRSRHNGMVEVAGSEGAYWSSTVILDDALSLYFGENFALTDNDGRAYGFSVRCIQD